MVLWISWHGHFRGLVSSRRRISNFKEIMRLFRTDVAVQVIQLVPDVQSRGPSRERGAQL